MIVEAYRKCKGGRTYFAVYHHFGNVGITVSGIDAEGKDAAVKKAAGYLEKALKEYSQVNQ